MVVCACVCVCFLWLVSGSVCVYVVLLNAKCFPQEVTPGRGMRAASHLKESPQTRSGMKKKEQEVHFRPESCVDEPYHNAEDGCCNTNLSLLLKHQATKHTFFYFFPPLNQLKAQQRTTDLPMAKHIKVFFAVLA